MNGESPKGPTAPEALETDSAPNGRKSKGGRNYVPKGMGNGGRRPGAGRKAGTKNVLPLGTVAVLNAARIARKRLGDDAHPDDLAAVTRVYERVADVLEERVDWRSATPVLKAGAMVADAVAGPLAQKHEHAGEGGGPLEVVIRDLSKEPEEE